MTVGVDELLGLTGGEVVLVGEFRLEEQRSLFLSIDSGSTDVCFVRSTGEFQARLGVSNVAPPRCVLVDMRLEDARDFISWMRSDVRLYAVPVIAMVDSAARQAFDDAYAAGADDVVARRRMNVVARRVEVALRTQSATTLRAPAYSALVIGTNVKSRRLLGRTLRVAGYSPSFADSLEDASERIVRDNHDIAVIVHDNADVLGWELVESLRAATRYDLPVIVVSKDNGKERDARLTTRHRAAFIGENAPVDNVIFAANEIIRPVQTRQRGSSRLLFGTLCSYRAEGQLAADHGYTYNVSRGGLYIRTMDAPAMGSKVSIELTPPYSNESVTLVARVQWTRSFTDGHGGPSPAGFGVEILRDESDPQAVRAYEMAYSVLARVNQTPEDDTEWAGEYILVDDAELEEVPSAERPADAQA